MGKSAGPENQGVIGVAGSNPVPSATFKRNNMADLEEVIIKFKCDHCKKEITMSAFELMEAGIEGPPYCDCRDDHNDLIVIDTYIIKRNC